MRILHVVRQYHPSIGGLEQFVAALARHQRESGLEPRVLTLDRCFRAPDRRLPADEVIDCVGVTRIPWRGSHRYPLAPGALKALAGADLVHVHGVDFFCDYLAWTWPIHRKPMVLSTHGGFFHTGFARVFKRVFFNTMTRASVRAYGTVVACSVGDEALFRPIAGSRLLRIDNGVDLARFAGAASPTATRRILYFGRIARNKRLDLLLAAFAELARTDRVAELHIAGRDWDGSLAGVRADIARLGLAERAHLHEEPPDDALRTLMGRCSFFASASEYEGFGLAMVEAMSAGLVPLVSDIPSFTSILEHSRIGSAIDFADPVASAERMRVMMDAATADPGSRQRMQAASTPWSWSSVAPRFTEVYRAVLGEQRRRILGVSIEALKREEAVEAIDRGLAQGHTIKVACANAHTLNLARHDSAYRRALSDFLVLNDGVGVDIASWIKFGRPFAENLNGTDFFPHYLDASHHALRIYLLGARPAVVQKAAQVLGARYARHAIVGWHHGYFDPGQGSRIAAEIRQARPDVVLVALGNPRQELWIAEHAAATGAKVLFGVGALFDFVAGEVPRAPVWIRRLRCEWVFRLMLEPRRMWRRYLIGNFVFLISVLGDGR